MAVCLLGVLLVLFGKALLPDYAVFSNDGSLGQVHAQWSKQPGDLTAVWRDLNWLGGAEPSGLANISAAFFGLVGCLGFAKFYAPFALFLLGLSAWLCFRQWKFSREVCVAGGLAAALNSDFFSTACWGVATQPIGLAMDFLALAALADQSSPRRWVRVVLAGMAVGMGVMEAFDIGALFSLFVAAFVVFQAVNGEGRADGGEGPGGQRGLRKLAAGVVRVAVVAVFAALLAAGALSSLIGTQIKGVAGMGQDAASKAQRWDQATQWSLPKRETLGILIPGLFGFRMETPKDVAAFPGWFEHGEYWGAVGQDASYDRYFEAKRAGQQAPAPHGFSRYTGGGCYAGVLVILVALWAAVRSFRKGDAVYCLAERRFIRFWVGAAVVSLLLGYGRYAPFYQLFYALPYMSTIRNPAKFIHVFSWVLVILFGYGLEGLSRLGLQSEAAQPGQAPPRPTRGQGLGAHWRAWWAKAAAFDKNWVKGSGIALGVALLGWLVYACSRDRLGAYLQEVDIEAARADLLAGFSLRQVGWFIAVLAPSLGLVAVVLSGYFNGRRARTGAVLVGVLLAVDLMAANLPWVVIFNWKQAYATNPVLDFLRAKPYEQRVSNLPVLPLARYLGLERLPKEMVEPSLTVAVKMRGLYEGEWLQHLFEYYDIQALDVYMNPRAAVEYVAYESALGPTLLRHWELTNTRYLFGPAMLGPVSWADLLNARLDPAQKRFQVALRFDLELKPGVTEPHGYGEEVTAVVSTNGAFALFEFTGALPRAKLYANWQVSTNDEATLKQLADPAFDPQRTVLVSSAPEAAGRKDEAADTQKGGPPTVQFMSYAPKRIELRANAAAPSVLLLNDHYDPNWKVTVDGRPAALLKCNYAMRGVQVLPGTHQVEFRFQPSIKPLCVSVAAIALGLGLLAYLVVRWAWGCWNSWHHPS